MLEYILPVSVYCEDSGCEDPTHAKIVLDKKLIARIKKLNRAAKSLKVYCIEEFDYTPEFLVSENEDGSDLKEWDGSVDTLQLKVTDSDFRWTGYFKNTNIEVDTESIGIKELNENLKVLRAKSEDLPRLLVSDKLHDSSKAIVEKRLKGE